FGPAGGSGRRFAVRLRRERARVSDGGSQHVLLPGRWAGVDDEDGRRDGRGRERVHVRRVRQADELERQPGERVPVRRAADGRDRAAVQYLRARYYDPDTGTFLSRDPLATL